MAENRPSWRQAQTIALKRAIQSAALRLIGERGYAATTVGMVAEEVGIAERTCYRHFPAKADMVLWDAADYDLLMHFRARPPGERVIAAFREALRAGYGMLTDEQRLLEQQRSALISSNPELRAAHLDHLTSAAEELTAAVAERSRLAPDDPNVVAVSGAILGILMVAQLISGAAAPLDDILDAALARLEHGLAAL